MKLTTLLSLAASTLALLFFAVAPAAACSCSYGASCGVDLGPMPCGVTVCGNDYQNYKCTSGTWVPTGQSCTCADAPGDAELKNTAISDTADSPFFAPTFVTTESGDCDPAASDAIESTETHDSLETIDSASIDTPIVQIGS